MIPLSAAGFGSLFVYGTLTDEDVLSRVLARTPAVDELQSAWLDGFRRVQALGANYPLLVPARGTAVRGSLLRRTTRQDIVRLNHFEGGEYWAERHAIRLEGGSTREAWLYGGLPSLVPGNEPWELPAWQAQHKQAFLAQCDAWMADCPGPD
jgi:ADP-ribose pyrophosphatase